MKEHILKFLDGQDRWWYRGVISGKGAWTLKKAHATRMTKAEADFCRTLLERSAKAELKIAQQTVLVEEVTE